eukprot:gene7090-7891_t
MTIVISALRKAFFSTFDDVGWRDERRPTHHIMKSSVKREPKPGQLVSQRVLIDISQLFTCHDVATKSKNGEGIQKSEVAARARLISYKNIRSLLELYRGTSWNVIADLVNFKLYQCMKDDDLIIKGEFEVEVPASHAYKYLSDEKKRLEWDEMIVDVKVINDINGGDAILYYVMQNINPSQRMKPDDFVMLVSRRPSLDQREPFTIAYRSVTLNSLPSKPEYNRAENLCSGFLIESCKNSSNCCKITYINHLTKEVFEYVKGALKGTSGLHRKRSERLSNLLLESLKKDEHHKQ